MAPDMLDQQRGAGTMFLPESNVVSIDGNFEIFLKL